MNIYGRVGWRTAAVAPSSGIDADAQAFITAASITDSTQQSAINTLVTQLKTYGIWTKLKAVYPMVGGSASSHKFNLKDPRDLDAAYRLVFSGGWTHSSTGALPNGTTGYADTKFAPGTVGMSTSSFTLFSYNRNTSSTGTSRAYLGSSNSNLAGSNYTLLGWLNGGTQEAGSIAGDRLGTEYSPTTLLSAYNGLKLITTNDNRNARYYKNGAFITNQVTQTKSFDAFNIYLSAVNTAGTSGLFSNQEQAFAGIADGLTDTEAANFYTAVQTFQTTLGRQVGVPIVADADAQAFLDAAVITDQTQANAVTTLVTDLKSANIWSKMKAIYPFVGGTATTHKFNLKDPRDLDAAFRLTFSGGWTHSSNGAQPNGTTGYADTKLIPSSTLNLISTHISVYLNTNYASSVDTVDMGVEDASYTNRFFIEPSTIGMVYSINNSNGVNFINTQDLNSLGLYVNNRISSTTINLFKNNIKLINDTARTSSSLSVRPLYIGAHNFVGSAAFLSPRRQAFASIGDGLTDAEAAAFYTAVQKYQTSLSRNV